MAYTAQPQRCQVWQPDLDCQPISNAAQNLLAHVCALQADDVNSRLCTARSNLAAATDKYQALLLGPSAKRLLELIGNPSPVPHGGEVFVLWGHVVGCCGVGMRSAGELLHAEGRTGCLARRLRRAAVSPD